MPVYEMLTRMSSRELSEWAVFFKLEQEDRDQEELAATAQQGVQNAKARPRP